MSGAGRSGGVALAATLAPATPGATGLDLITRPILPIIRHRRPDGRRRRHHLDGAGRGRRVGRLIRIGGKLPVNLQVQFLFPK